MSTKMHMNGWMIERLNDDSIKVCPINDNKIRQCLVQVDPHYSIANVTVVDKEAKNEGIKNDVTIFHNDKVDVKTANAVFMDKVSESKTFTKEEVINELMTNEDYEDNVREMIDRHLDQSGILATWQKWFSGAKMSDSD